MEFLNYRGIKSKLRKRSGLLFKKPNPEDASSQFYSLARQLDEHKLYAGLCHLAITSCNLNQSPALASASATAKQGQLGALLNAARSFAQADQEIVFLDDHIRTVIWIYNEALLCCDNSFIKPICLEMGRFYESHRMYQQAAECFKQSMSISRCVNNLILCKRYCNALKELKNCPSHLMTTKEQTSMFLLELLLNENSDEFNESSLQNLAINSRTYVNGSALPVDDHLFSLHGLLESLLIFKRDTKNAKFCSRINKVKQSLVDKLCTFLDPTQIQLLHLITGPNNT